MINKILKIEFISLVILSFLNLVYFSYQESLPDNFYEIHSHPFSTILYFPTTLLAHIGFFTGLWTFISLCIFSILYIRIRNHKSSFNSVVSLMTPLSLAVIIAYLFLPMYLGNGLLSVLERHSNQVFWYFAFVIHVFVLIKFFNPSLFQKIVNRVSSYKLESINLENYFKKFNLIDRIVLLKKNFSATIPKNINLKKEYFRKEKSEESISKVDNYKLNEEIEEKIESESVEPEKQDYVELLETDQEDIYDEFDSNNNINDVFFDSNELIDCIVVKKQPSTKSNAQEDQYYKEISNTIEEKLKEFGIQSNVINLMKGPVVNTFELNLGSGVSVAAVIKRTDDLSLALWGAPLRMVYPMKGKNTIGVEVPRSPREVIYLDEVLKSEAFLNSNLRLPIAMGKDAYGESTIMDLASMPHMLVAGSTGAGKSVFINTLLVSLIIKLSPTQLKLILIDPKQLELAHYQHLPHLILPVVTDPQTTSLSLLWAVEEMERRYSLMKEIGVRNIEGYNKRIEEMDHKKLEKIAKFFTDPDAKDYKIPYLVIIVDEFADLVLSKSGKEIEANISRLAAKARASGIHIILATQRPSTDVITGVIKANFPTRVSFRVTSNTDSRVVLDTPGAEKLLGKGDMLFKLGIELMRLHSAYVDEAEIEVLVSKLSTLPTQHSQEALEFIENSRQNDELISHDISDFGSEKDELYEQAVQIVAEQRLASASMLQRRLKVGYNRAANLIEEMEKKGIIGPQQGSKPRNVLISVNNINE
jgi:S-DNA-T family DNA segregation ATPase FtsK/SpoIIIE